MFHTQHSNWKYRNQRRLEAIAIAEIEILLAPESVRFEMMKSKICTHKFWILRIAFPHVSHGSCHRPKWLRRMLRTVESTFPTVI